ncbi:universal stress protein [Pseudoalteromonas sp. SG41-2]|uniref:universal stress protein n=1 Tax=unclassified Pseudoalteromonas TaxID=194690 RepID=UPI001604211B|nr:MULTISPECIES: universal stress protein [unclassified Pseudoalteromonas]MBB1435486.1 universal stress protein [Pseudoalteromonas sp. SG43-6]MBB1477973.1 universal stress protein [Pseudoalteromonas sp. SG41-2]
MNKIITCIDGSIYTDDVCKAGIWAAKKLNKSMLFLHAIEKQNAAMIDDLSGIIGFGATTSLLSEMATLDEQRSKLALQIGKEMLEHASVFASQQGCKSIESKQRHSGIVEAICDLEDAARLIVIGRSGKTHEQNFKAIGSHIEQVIRHVHTPILIANRHFSEPNNFMLAYDGRETADKMVKQIIAGGLLHHLTCHLVTVENGKHDLLEKFKRTEALLVESGFEVKSSILEGNIFSSLMAYKAKNEIEMLVMGAFSHSKIAHAFLGSNTLKMIENTQLPLVILR